MYGFNNFDTINIEIPINTAAKSRKLATIILNDWIRSGKSWSIKFSDNPELNKAKEAAVIINSPISTINVEEIFKKYHG